MNIIGKVISRDSNLDKYNQFIALGELPPTEEYPRYKIVVGSWKEKIETGETFKELAPFASLASFLDVVSLVLEGAFLLGVHSGFTPQQIKVKIHNYVEDVLSRMHRKYGSATFATQQPIKQKIGVT